MKLYPVNHGYTDKLDIAVNYACTCQSECAHDSGDNTCSAASKLHGFFRLGHWAKKVKYFYFFLFLIMITLISHVVLAGSFHILNSRSVKIISIT